MNKPLTFLFDFEFFGSTVQDCGNPQMQRYALEQLAALGVRHLVLSDTLLLMFMRQLPLMENFQREMQSAGLDFVDAHAPFGSGWDLNCASEARRGVVLAMHRHVMEIAAFLGVRTITIHTGNNGPANPEAHALTLEQNIDNICRSLEALLPEAERLGLVICIENIWFPCNTAEVLLEIKRRFPTPALGFCYDAGHANLQRSRVLYLASPAPRLRALAEDPDEPLGEKILRTMLPHIVNCHLHDNDGSLDQHRLPGNGTIRWDRIGALLRTAPRLQCLQSEVLPVRTDTPLTALVPKFRELFGDWTD